MRFFLGISLSLLLLFTSLFSLQASEQNQSENLLSLALIQFWQKVISPADGARSPSFPTGSRYAKDAFQRYPYFTAMVLTAERLLHEADFPQGKTIQINGNPKFYDPVIANTYWWDEDYQIKIQDKIKALKTKMKQNENIYSKMD